MTLQDLLDLQRYLKETRPDLRGGSHEWWIAMKAEIEKRKK